MELSGSASLVMSNALTREGLSRILSDNGFCIAQSVSDIEEITDCEDHDRHIIIVDYSYCEEKIDGDIQNILSRFPRSKLVILGDDFDIKMLSHVFFAGAHGYIIKNIAYQAFIAKMHLILMNEKVAPSNLIDAVIDASFTGNPLEEEASNPNHGLSEREQDILQRLVMGQPNKLISRELGVSEATVKVSVQSIFRKMSVKNRTQAAIMAKDYKTLRKAVYVLTLIAVFLSDSADIFPAFA
ncbi:MAG: response regulator transcription factor [Sphingobium sp.]|nr:response regulator transcription factor [Sphingobium sp.]